MQTAQEAVDRALEILIDRRQNGVTDEVAIQQAIAVLAISSVNARVDVIVLEGDPILGRAWP